MRCTCLFFAQLAEAAGSHSAIIDLPDAATVGDAIEELALRYPGLEKWRDRIAVAVNERYVHAAAKLEDDDTIALIPPVSGG